MTRYFLVFYNFSVDSLGYKGNGSGSMDFSVGDTYLNHTLTVQMINKRLQKEIKTSAQFNIVLTNIIELSFEEWSRFTGEVK